MIIFFLSFLHLDPLIYAGLRDKIDYLYNLLNVLLTWIVFCFGSQLGYTKKQEERNFRGVITLEVCRLPLTVYFLYQVYVMV